MLVTPGSSYPLGLNGYGAITVSSVASEASVVYGEPASSRVKLKRRSTRRRIFANALSNVNELDDILDEAVNQGTIIEPMLKQ